MKNEWIFFYSGIVTVKVSGKGLERFINMLTRSDILVWNVKRHGTESLTFKMKLDNVNNLRHLVRNSDCKIEFLTRTGLPFFIKKLLKNSGFLVGSGIFFIIIFLLSNMIWGIEIKGADPATEYKIVKELDRIGVKKGNLQFLVGDPEHIQRTLSSKINEITWVGIELQGTTYHLQVVEKNEPEKPEIFGPRNLIAAKKAVIVDMFVEEGQPVVAVNDHVLPGDLLVSGEIGKEGATKIVSAKGEILGETWYKSEVSLPLKSNFQVFNGNENIKHSLRLGDLIIPFWGFKEQSYSEFEKETDEKSFHFLKWKLPITYVVNTYRESEKMTRVYTEKEALEVAKEMARKDILSGLPVDAKIKGENILHVSYENGKVYLKLHFQVIENIAKEYPIIQGESE